MTTADAVHQCKNRSASLLYEGSYEEEKHCVTTIMRATHCKFILLYTPPPLYPPSLNLFAQRSWPFLCTGHVRGLAAAMA